MTLFSGDQYIGSVFRRPVDWLCFQETSRLALFSENSILALFSGHWLLFSGDQYIGSVFRRSGDKIGPLRACPTPAIRSDMLVI